MSWIFSSIGGYLSAMWSGAYNYFAAPSPASPSLLGGAAAAAAASNNSAKLIAHKAKPAEYPLTRLPTALIANCLSYTTPDDTAPICLAMAQCSSQLRDRVAPHVFAQLHNVVRFARATPAQDEHVLAVFAKARAGAAVIDTLALREVRAEPLPALRMLVARAPLQLTTLDLYKTDIAANGAIAELAQLIGQCVNLTSVTLSDCCMTHPAAVAALVPTLLTKLPKLRRLDLSNNRFRVDGAVALASQPLFIDPSVMADFVLPHLEHLDLGGNALGARGVETLLRVHFPGKTTPKLKLLDLRDNTLRDEGARLVTRFLATVSMPNSASVGAATAAAGGGLKPSPVAGLEVLEMSDNEVTPEAAQAMRTAFGASVRIFA